MWHVEVCARGFTASVGVLCAAIFALFLRDFKFGTAFCGTKWFTNGRGSSSALFSVGQIKLRILIILSDFFKPYKGTFLYYVNFNNVNSDKINENNLFI